MSIEFRARSSLPTTGPPPPVIPEVPFGTIVNFLSMFTVLAGFIGVKRFRKTY